MERRAKILLVALFLLVSVAGVVAFLNWISPAGEEEVTRRRVQFEGSVSGLSVGSEVRYLGVPVGRVLDIDLAAGQPGRVDVEIGLDRELSDPGELLGSLEPLGITGLALIELRHREPGATLIEVEPDVIPGQPSAFSAVPAAASRVAEQLDTVLARVAALLTDQAVEDLGQTIHALRTLTGNLARASEEIDTLVATLGQVSTRVDSMLPAYEALARKVDRDVVPVLMETGRSVRASSDALTATLGDNRAELKQLLAEELPSLSRQGDELARSLEALRQLIQNINNQPGAVLYGTPVVETEIPRE